MALLRADRGDDNEVVDFVAEIFRSGMVSLLSRNYAAQSALEVIAYF